MRRRGWSVGERPLGVASLLALRRSARSVTASRGALAPSFGSTAVLATRRRADTGCCGEVFEASERTRGETRARARRLRHGFAVPSCSRRAAAPVNSLFPTAPRSNPRLHPHGRLAGPSSLGSNDHGDQREPFNRVAPPPGAAGTQCVRAQLASATVSRGPRRTARAVVTRSGSPTAAVRVQVTQATEAWSVCMESPRAPGLQGASALARAHARKDPWVSRKAGVCLGRLRHFRA